MARRTNFQISEADFLKFSPGKVEVDPIRVIRTLDEEEKRLLTVLFKLRAEVNDLGRKHVDSHNARNCSDEDCRQYDKKAYALKSKIETVQKIFWTSVQMSLLEENCSGNMQILPGWQLAQMPFSENDEDESGLQIIEISLENPFLGRKAPFGRDWLTNLFNRRRQ